MIAVRTAIQHSDSINVGQAPRYFLFMIIYSNSKGLSNMRLNNVLFYLCIAGSLLSLRGSDFILNDMHGHKCKYHI